MIQIQKTTRHSIISLFSQLMKEQRKIFVIIRDTDSGFQLSKLRGARA